MLQEEQGQDHRKAWLGKDLERSSGSEPPDMDQVTGPGKAATGWTTNGLPSHRECGHGQSGTGMGH